MAAKKKKKDVANRLNKKGKDELFVLLHTLFPFVFGV